MEGQLAGPELGFFDHIDQRDLATRCEDDVGVAAGEFGEAVTQGLFAEIVDVSNWCATEALGTCDLIAAGLLQPARDNATVG